MKQFTIDLITVKSHSNYPGANKGNPLNITRGKKKIQIKMLKSEQPVSAVWWGEQISFNFVFSNIYHVSFSLAFFSPSNFFCFQVQQARSHFLFPLELFGVTPPRPDTNRFRVMLQVSLCTSPKHPGQETMRSTISPKLQRRDQIQHL